ncbi:structural maintenance of chromosomes protein 6, partial [Massariosphaeria phaeospora]
FLRTTQVVTKQLQENRGKQNQASETGIIEEIRCTNFMCHEQLTVPLGPLINFIIGNNGSGKSAVLTALTLCLGGKATSTNRGQSLKSFIKEGKDFCNLAVKLKNQGSGAYKYNQYGDSIIVERHFNKTGSSGFKLKDRNGKIFFLLGTQLETLSRDYATITNDLNEHQAKREVLEGDLDRYRKRAEDAVKLAKQAHSLGRRRDDERALAHQAAWAQVQQEEAKAKELQEEIDRVGDLIKQRTEEAQTNSDKYDEINQLWETAKQEVQECEDAIEPAEQERMECKGKFDETRKELIKAKTEMRDIASLITSRKSNIKKYESQIEELRQRQAEADNGVHAEKMRELDEAKERCQQVKAEWENHTSSKSRLTDRHTSVQDRINPTDERLRSKKLEEKRSKDSIDQLGRGQRRWQDSYHRSLLSLIHAIENDGGFRDPPTGPLGRYVQLLKPEWGHILEKQFAHTLNSFVVTNKNDQVRLSALMKRCGYNGGVLIGNGNVIDTAGHEPDPKLQTWMRVLQINNHLVRNQLIINARIDQTVLIETRSEAHDFMNAGGPPRNNVIQCFSMADDGPRRGHIFNITSSGNVGVGPIEGYNGQLRMQADKEPQLRAEKANLERIQGEVRSIEAEARELRTQLRACEASIQEHYREHKRFKVAFQQAQTNVETLESELSAATPDAAAIEQLQGDLDTARGELQFQEGQYQDTIVGKDKLDANNRDKAQKLGNQRSDALRDKNHALEQIDAAVQNKSVWEDRYTQQLEEIRTYVSQAEIICPRVQVPKGATFDSLNNKRLALVKIRETLENSLGGSEDELLAEANDAKRQHKNAREEYLRNHSIQIFMQNALVQRRTRWNRFRSEIALRARVTFSYLLAERSYRGTMSIDHNSRQLEIHVQPDTNVASGAGRQTNTLSGGEKSFATVCLLLSLWDAMGSPIRCLDEFDVFMDSVNRDRAMNMIINAARQAIGRQYIIITPQAMDNVDSQDDVRIIRMRDPDRGQTTINFG